MVSYIFLKTIDRNFYQAKTPHIVNMPNPGNSFRDAIIEIILSWNIENLQVYKEPWVGSRFVGTKRKIDVVLKNISNDKTLGIEAKTQQTEGTAYQKLSYTIEDAKSAPIPVIIVFSGNKILPDMKARLIASGIGIEVEWNETEGLTRDIDVLKQRILIELGMDWLNDQVDRKVHASP